MSTVQPPESTPSSNDLVRQDRELVDRCLAGDVLGWKELYERYHDRLMKLVRMQIGKADLELVEEVVSRVWFVAVANDGQLLDRFDPERGCRLMAFLGAIARNQLKSFFRSEGRRRRREKAVMLPDSVNDAQPIDITEFLDTLTAAERAFYENHLIRDEQTSDQSASKPLSDANRWQLNRRVRCKFDAFLHDEDNE